MENSGSNQLHPHSSLGQPSYWVGSRIVYCVLPISLERMLEVCVLTAQDLMQLLITLLSQGHS